jgi:hypothetical protein
LSLLPPGIPSDLSNALAIALLALIFGFFFGAVVFGILLLEGPVLLMHPQVLLQLLLVVLPQQLLQLGL